MSIRQVDGLFAASYETDWGEGWVYVREGRLIGVDLPGEVAGPCLLAAADLGKQAGAGAAPGALEGRPAAADADALRFWAAQLDAYFAGERTTWTPAEVPLAHLGLGCFEERVYEALLSVGPGETVSYGELAEMAGYPRAARAVGNAMAANPIPVVVPCHRVIRSDGSMGRYGKDPTWKERLLRHEGWTNAEGS
jgi:methylated-DNA-[protein]-cysteine S-methyltransferase